VAIEDCEAVEAILDSLGADEASARSIVAELGAGSKIKIDEDGTMAWLGGGMPGTVPCGLQTHETGTRRCDVDAVHSRFERLDIFENSRSDARSFARDDPEPKTGRRVPEAAIGDGAVDQQATCEVFSYAERIRYLDECPYPVARKPPAAAYHDAGSRRARDNR